MKVSEIFHKAADEYLWSGVEDMVYFPNSVYMCAVVSRASAGRELSFASALNFLRYIGVETDSTFQFDEITAGLERQGARYACLKFAALFAEEQGL